MLVEFAEVVERITDAVQQQSTHRAHVNGHVLVAKDSVLDLGEDVTGRFVDVA